VFFSPNLGSFDENSVRELSLCDLTENRASFIIYDILKEHTHRKNPLKTYRNLIPPWIFSSGSRSGELLRLPGWQ
jgi:hypothetical protein